MLPAVALAIVTLVLAWPQVMPDERAVRIGQTTIETRDIEALRVLNPRYIGVDQDQRPFQVTANSATQIGNADGAVQLEQPKADLTDSAGAWIALSARDGLYDRTGRTLDLEGAVQMFQEAGGEVRTSKARVLLDRSTIIGDQPVEAQGPAGYVTGQGFEVRERGAVVLFTGRSSLVLYRTTETEP